MRIRHWNYRHQHVAFAANKVGANGEIGGGKNISSKQNTFTRSHTHPHVVPWQTILFHLGATRTEREFRFQKLHAIHVHFRAQVLLKLLKVVKKQC